MLQRPKAANWRVFFASLELFLLLLSVPNVIFPYFRASREWNCCLKSSGAPGIEGWKLTCYPVSWQYFKDPFPHCKASLTIIGECEISPMATVFYICSSVFRVNASPSPYTLVVIMRKVCDTAFESMDSQRRMYRSEICRQSGSHRSV